MRRFVLDINCKKRDKIEKFVLKTKRELDNFFGVKLSVPYIHLIHNRKDFNLISGKKTERWGVGSVYGRAVFILAAEVFEKESSHKKKEFWNVLKHEIVHIYYQTLTNNYKPSWLDEGLACYLAKQNKKPMHLKEIVKAVNYFQKHDEKIYQLGYNLVNSLIKRFGKDKIIKLIKTLNYHTSKKEFNKNFKKVYGFGLNKEELLKKLEVTIPNKI